MHTLNINTPLKVWIYGSKVGTIYSSNIFIQRFGYISYALGWCFNIIKNKFFSSKRFRKSDKYSVNYSIYCKLNKVILHLIYTLVIGT